MPVTTGEQSDFKEVRKSISFLGQHRYVDRQKALHILHSLDTKQEVVEESAGGPLTIRKRFSLEAEQGKREDANRTMHRLERGYVKGPLQKVWDPRGTLPIILSKRSKYQRKRTDAVDQSVTRLLKSKDRTKVKDDESAPLPVAGTIQSERTHFDASAATDRTHSRYKSNHYHQEKTRLRQEDDPHRDTAHRNRKYLMDFVGEGLSGYPATERKRRIKEDENTATGRVRHHSHLHPHQQHQERYHLDVAAENYGHHHRRRRRHHHLSERYDRLVKFRNDQAHEGHSHLEESEEDPSIQTKNPSKKTINDSSKQTIKDHHSKQTINDPLKQITNDPSKLTIEDHVKPVLKDHLKRTTEDPLNQTVKDNVRSPKASFDVTQRIAETRRTGGQLVQNEEKRVLLDLLKGRSRRPGSSRRLVREEPAAGVQPLRASRCDFHVLDDLRRGSPSHETENKDVRKYIRENNLMPPDKEKWIKQWLMTVSPSIRDEDLDCDPAPPKP